MAVVVQLCLYPMHQFSELGRKSPLVPLIITLTSLILPTTILPLLPLCAFKFHSLKQCGSSRRLRLFINNIQLYFLQMFLYEFKKLFDLYVFKVTCSCLITTSPKGPYYNVYSSPVKLFEIYKVCQYLVCYWSCNSRYYFTLPHIPMSPSMPCYSLVLVWL